MRRCRISLLVVPVHHHVRVVSVRWTLRDGFEHHRKSLVDGATLNAAPAPMSQQPGETARKMRSDTFDEREPGSVVVRTAAEREKSVRPKRGGYGHDVCRVAVRVDFDRG